jgi:hypothetical protein
MAANDPISLQLDALARLLEDNGYAVEVDYTDVSITVWADVWPVQLRLNKCARDSNRSSAGRKDEDEKNRSK